MEVSSLLTREITPEDYEMLLKLDEAVPKKTAGADLVERLPQASLKDFEGGTCAVCICPLVEVGEVVVLPCKHYFHRSCVSTWLSDYGKSCPVCSASLAE